MPAKRTTIVVALALAAMVVLINRNNFDGSQTRDEHPASSSGVTAVADRGALATARIIRSDSGIQPIQVESALPATGATNSTNAAEFVAAILANPAQPPLPSTIPALSDAQVDQLAIAYLKLGRPTEKAAILWALGYSQNHRAFDTLQYALTSEYSGAVLSSTENVSQLQVVPMIGVLARTSDRAWQFLVNLTRPDAWGWIQVWSDGHLTEQYQSEERSLAQVRYTLQGKVITALAASGRPEFMTWANSLYEGGVDPASFNQRHANFVAAGVFRATYLAEHGFDEFDDIVMYGTQQGRFAHGRWIQSPEGQRWTRWWKDQVAHAMNRESANQNREVPESGLE